MKLAPMSALLDAPRRRRDKQGTTRPSRSAEVLKGLAPGTFQALRDLAVRNLDSLGVVETDQFVDEEMAHTFSSLVAGIPEGPRREEMLRDAIRQAMEEEE